MNTLILKCSLLICFYVVSGIATAQSFSEDDLNGVQIKKSFGVGNFKGYDDIPLENRMQTTAIIFTRNIKSGKCKVGLNLGLKLWNEDLLMPSYVSSMIELVEKYPMLILDAGYLFGTRDENIFSDKESGRTFIALGFLYDLELKNNAFTIQLAYKHQKMVSNYENVLDPNTPTLHKYHIGYGFIVGSFGLKF